MSESDTKYIHTIKEDIMKKKLATLALTGIMAVSSLSTAFAGSWLHDPVGWWYQNDDGSYPTSGWHWIDGNNDGTAECYYFDASGYCLLNTTTPDGYTVDSNGAWIVDGVIQAQQVVTPTFNAPVYTVTETMPVFAPSSATEVTVVQTSWTGSYPYVSGMVTTQPADGNFWTVNINTGKYHITPNVDGLLTENTAYYSGDPSVLESNGYSRCKKRGCE